MVRPWEEKAQGIPSCAFHYLKGLRREKQISFVVGPVSRRRRGNVFKPKKRWI